MRYIAAITKGNAITEIYKNEQNFLAFSVNEEKALAMGSAKEVISVLDGKNKISGLHLELMNARASYIYPQHEGFNYVRKTAHALKNGDDEAIESAARVMAQNLKDGSVLVPIPSACGKATSTLKLAIAIQKNSNKKIHVADLLHSEPRLSHYLAKKRGIALPIEAMAMHVKANSVPISKIVLVDNVLDTGKTITAARIALTSNVPALVFAVSLNQMHEVFARYADHK